MEFTIQNCDFARRSQLTRGYTEQKRGFHQGKKLHHCFFSFPNGTFGKASAEVTDSLPNVHSVVLGSCTQTIPGAQLEFWCCFFGDQESMDSWISQIYMIVCNYKQPKHVDVMLRISLDTKNKEVDCLNMYPCSPTQNCYSSCLSWRQNGRGHCSGSRTSQMNFGGFIHNKFSGENCDKQ